MNRHAASAQIESEDVDAVSVFITGVKDSSVRNANIDDLNIFASIDKDDGNRRFSIPDRVGNKGRTVCGFPHLAELVRHLNLDDLPNKIP